jgi:hypothetical protein
MLRVSDVGRTFPARPIRPITMSFPVGVSFASVSAAIAAMLISVGVGVTTSTVGWEIPAAALALASVVSLGIERPALFLAVALVVRPLLDVASEQTVHVGVGSINPAGAVGLCVLAISLGFILAASRITLPAISRPFRVVLAFSAVAAVVAYENFGKTAGISAITELIRLAAALGIFILAANVTSTSASVRRVFSIVALSALIPAISAIAEFASGNAIAPGGLLIERAFGTFSGPNPLGEYCAISALILIGAPASFMKRGVRFAALATILGALAISYSRAGYAMLLIGIIAIEYRRISRRMVWMAIVLAVVLIAVPSVRNRVLPTGTTAAPQERFARTGQSGLLAGNGTYGSFGWRLYNWSKLLGKWEQSPTLGFGLQTTVLVNPVRQNLPNGKAQGFLAHNAVVRCLIEGGPIMLLLWGLLCFSLIRQSARAKHEPWELQPYARVLWGIWIAVVVIAATTDDPFSGGALLYSCFALTGVLQAAYDRHRMALFPREQRPRHQAQALHQPQVMTVLRAPTGHR